MARNQRSRHKVRSSSTPGSTPLRIIGGQLGGRSVQWQGDPRTRPMKQRVREAVFNLLGPRVRQKHVLDLFAGTGAMGLEALSRGAAAATFIEQHFPTARQIRENIAALELQDRTEVVMGNAFRWTAHCLAQPRLKEAAWLVFCCPPYDFYVQRATEMATLLAELLQHAPPASVLVVECDERLDTSQLPQAERWEVRKYPPAVIAIRDVDAADGRKSGDAQA